MVFERFREPHLTSSCWRGCDINISWDNFTHYQRNIDLTTVFNETLTGVLHENRMSHNFIKRLFWKNCALTTYATGQRILMTNCEGGIFFFFFFAKNLVTRKNNLKDKCIENLRSLKGTPWFSQNSFPRSLSLRFIIQSIANISTTNSLGTEKIGRCGELAVMGRWGV